MSTIVDQYHRCEYMFVAGRHIGELCGREALWTLANGKHYCKTHATQLRESVGGMSQESL